MMITSRAFLLTLGLAFALLTSGGCATKAGTGALVGGAGGAAVGGLIGSMSHSRAGAGMLIGGAVGALGGAIVGNEMDKQDAKNAERYDDRPSRADRGSEPRHVTKEDVIAWSSRGDRDEAIIDRIEHSGTVFRLSARDENDLRDAGVSDEVIRAMKATGRRQ